LFGELKGLLHSEIRVEETRANQSVALHLAKSFSLAPQAHVDARRAGDVGRMGSVQRSPRVVRPVRVISSQVAPPGFLVVVDIVGKFAGPNIVRPVVELTVRIAV